MINSNECSYIYFEPSEPPPNPETFRQRQHNIPLLIGLNNSQRLHHPSLRNADAAYPTDFRTTFRFDQNHNEKLTSNRSSKLRGNSTIHPSPIDVNACMSSVRESKSINIESDNETRARLSDKRFHAIDNENSHGHIAQPLHWNMNREQTLASFAARSQKHPSSTSQANTSIHNTQQTSLLQYLPNSKENSKPIENKIIGGGDDGKRKVRSKKKTKKKRQKSTGATSLPSLSSSMINISAESLKGIDECGFLNAGQSHEALDVFIQNCSYSGLLAWTMVYADFSSSLDDDITSKDSIHDPQIFAALFILPQHEENNDSQLVDNDCFLLPLCRCLTDTPEEEIEDVSDHKRMHDWPIAPFVCGVSLLKRWKTLKSILMMKDLICVTFNARKSFLPLHQHQEYDLGLPLDPLVLACTTFDIQLAAWMLKPHATDKDLAFSSLICAIPVSNSSPCSTNTPQGSSEYLTMLCRVKDRTSKLLFDMYPTLDAALKKKGLYNAFNQLESVLQSLLCAMECTGIGFLPATFSNIQLELEGRISELTLEAKHIAGDDSFLCSSPQQVSHLLYDVLRLPILVTTNTAKHRSTSEAVLEEIKKQAPHRIIDILLEFRVLHKLLTSFVQPLPCLSKRYGDLYRIHPIWMQTAVRTGRLSCRRPNMQQIPNEAKVFHVHPRDAFCPTRKDACLFSFDYSQNEVRILAHITGDSKLLSLFNNDNMKDIYKEMSSLVTGKSINAVSSDERAITKQVVLAILYGMGVPQVAKKLGISRDSAQHFFDSFYNRFYVTKRWMDRTKESVRSCGFITTIAGRRRYLDDIHSVDMKKRAQAERQAVNSIIQGSAADLMKLAMIKICSYILLNWKMDDVTSPKPKLLLQIHDELLFEVSNKDSDIEQLKNAVHSCCADECRNDLKLKVPLKLSCSVGKTWGSMRPI